MIAWTPTPIITKWAHKLNSQEDRDSDKIIIKKYIKTQKCQKEKVLKLKSCKKIYRYFKAKQLENEETKNLKTLKKTIRLYYII